MYEDVPFIQKLLQLCDDFGVPQVVKRIKDSVPQEEHQYVISIGKLYRLTHPKDDHPIKFSMDELRVISRFLERYNNGVGLNAMPLFEHSPNFANYFYTPMQAMDILIGSCYQSSMRGDTVSAWDLHALCRINGLGNVPKDVLRVHHWQEPRHQGRWAKSIASNRSICSIGSPIGNISTERLMSNAFGVRAFSPSPNQLPPVYFVANRSDILFNNQSSFVYDPDDAAEILDGDIRAQMRSNSRAIVVQGGKTYLCPRTGDTYGALIAHLNPNYPNCIRLSLCGLFGTSTLGVAHLISIRGIIAQLPAKLSQETPVLVVIVKMNVGTWTDSDNNDILESERQSRDNRKLDYTSIVVEDVFILEKNHGSWETHAYNKSAVTLEV